jgi:hypothetical protein
VVVSVDVATAVRTLAHRTGAGPSGKQDLQLVEQPPQRQAAAKKR